MGQVGQFGLNVFKGSDRSQGFENQSEGAEILTTGG